MLSWDCFSKSVLLKLLSWDRSPGIALQGLLFPGYSPGIALPGLLSWDCSPGIALMGLLSWDCSLYCLGRMDRGPRGRPKSYTTLLWCGNRALWQRRIAVTAKPLAPTHARCSHSFCFFENVVKHMVLAAFQRVRRPQNRVRRPKNQEKKENLKVFFFFLLRGPLFDDFPRNC